MKEVQVLEYVSGYRDSRPRSNKRFLFWVALGIHALALFALIVVPLTRVDGDMPKFEAMTTFLVRPAPAPPPPPPPPPPAPPRARQAPKPARPRVLEASFLAPVAVPSAIPPENFGGGDYGVEGGVEGGIPGGIAGGIVGGLGDAPPAQQPAEPVRLDFRKEGARPIARVEPVYPDLAAQARVQGVVILEVLVDAHGVPASVNVLRSIPLLESAAIEAVRQWRWNPYKLLDRAVPFWVTVTVNFRLT
ncbi:MAG TPA: energy transducer TonB [Vicinamibacteria bacterium]|jgi:protein TonB